VVRVDRVIALTARSTWKRARENKEEQASERRKESQTVRERERERVLG